MEPCPQSANSFSGPRLAPHVLHFYEPGSFPAQSVAAYLAAGLAEGQLAVMIVTHGHGSDVKTALRNRGLDPEALERSGLLLALDVHALLASLRRQGALRVQDARDPLDALLASSARASPSGGVRVFGELVDQLAGAGEFAACLQMEAHWNRLLGQHPSCQLYCAYSTARFAEECSAPDLAAVCRLHEQLLPFASAPHSHAWLAPLLQQSAALQAAIQHRQVSERALHALELEYTRLFGEHVAHLQRCLEDRVALATLKKPPLPSPAEALEGLVERLLREILEECAAVCAARAGVPPDRPDAQKYIGEILAYGRLTRALCGLQQSVRARSLH